MSDPTPGTSKATAATVTVLIGGTVARFVVRIVQHNWPWLLDDYLIDGIGTAAVAGAVWTATYFTPHQLGGPT